MTHKALPNWYTLNEYDEAAQAIRAATDLRPRIGLVLGSGLSGLADSLEETTFLPYEAIPHFPVSTVEGHAGRLGLGKLAGVPVCVMQGRFHYYEGYTTQQTTFPVRVMARLGIETLILTNAAGGVNPSFRAGDLMVIEDHINFMGMAGENPLWGPNLSAFGLRFPSMTDVYTRSLRQMIHRVGQEVDVPLQRGVYAAVAGPSFETPAEIRYLRMVGADSVGMSTAPEATVAAHAGLTVLGISSITNVAIDNTESGLITSHEEVMETGRIIVPRLTRLLLAAVQAIHESGA
jgi:purine-nucleoside phosphorylase